jgi:hypothetical protein
MMEFYLLRCVSLLLALNDGDAFWWLTVAFGEHRTCAAEARGPHSTRLTDAVEKGKNEPTEIFACALAETGFV